LISFHETNHPHPPTGDLVVLGGLGSETKYSFHPSC
jgi:hypothetical protein